MAEHPTTARANAADGAASPRLVGCPDGTDHDHDVGPGTHRPTLLARSLQTLESLLTALAAVRTGVRLTTLGLPVAGLRPSGWPTRGGSWRVRRAGTGLPLATPPSFATLIGPAWLPEQTGADMPHPAIDARAVELADLLVASDPQAACNLLGELHQAAASMGALCGTVVEPAARRLGDLWQADDCSELDVTVGLCRMQTVLRQLGAEALHAWPSPRTADAAVADDAPAVLVAPLPGELHILGATLDAELLWQAGCDMQCEFPADDAALQQLLANSWFDALDLSLSTAFRREQWLPRMAATIVKARAASRNPQLVVVVGGRIFSERSGAGDAVGADASHDTAPRTMPSILQARDRHAAPTARRFH